MCNESSLNESFKRIYLNTKWSNECNSKHLSCDRTAQSCILSKIFWVASNSVVWLWLSRGAISSETEAATVRGVNRAEHARVEETVVYHSCKFETTPWALSCAISSPPPQPGCRIKVNKWMFKYCQICGSRGVDILHFCCLPACELLSEFIQKK